MRNCAEGAANYFRKVSRSADIELLIVSMNESHDCCTTRFFSVPGNLTAVKARCVGEILNYFAEGSERIRITLIFSNLALAVSCS